MSLNPRSTVMSRVVWCRCRKWTAAANWDPPGYRQRPPPSRTVEVDAPGQPREVRDR